MKINVKSGVAGGIAVSLALSALHFSISTCLGQATEFTYQGRLTDNGTNFSGVGQFKFALVTSTNFNHQAVAVAVMGGLSPNQFVSSCSVSSGGNGYVSPPTVSFSGGGGAGTAAQASLSGGSVNSITVLSPGSGYSSAPTVTISPPPPNISYVTFWSNDGTSVSGGEPASSVSVTVNNGLFTVVVGDTTLANMGGIDESIFSQRNLQLRIWFNDGVNGFAALPVQDLTPSPYAVAATTANSASNLLGTLPAAQLSGSLPASQLSGTLAVAQLPVGVVTNNASSVNLTGTFSGAGAMLWQVVSGTTQQAQPNAGYLLANGSLSTVTLPASPSAGDVVRVSGAGAGGWRIAQNAGQSVLSGNLDGNIGLLWSGHDIPRRWMSVVSSADGTKLAATVNADFIYTSTDSGSTWLARSNSPFAGAVASSADGTKLFATDGAFLYTSTNSGVNWQPRLQAPGQSEWAFLTASSADGSKLVAAVYGGAIYISADSGVTWAPQTNGIANAGNLPWTSLACSADGSRIFAAPTGGLIYMSTDLGATWAAQTNGIGNGGSQVWMSIASSADGTKVAAAALSDHIYTSVNGGTTWTARENVRPWSSVASSADGSKLVAAPQGGQIYISADSGVTWTPHDTIRTWNVVASSADGTKLAATVYNDQIFTSDPSSVSSTTLGTAGFLEGSPNSAIELQFLGNGLFLPLSHEGVIQAF